VRLYAKIGKALFEARTSGADAFAAIEAVLSWSAECALRADFFSRLR
jgi:hypothetical protein